MPIANLGSVQLHYQVSGVDGGPVLLLSNSLGTDMQLWEPLLPILDRHYRVLRYDTRGHGQSSVPSGDYTLDDLGQDAVHLLDHLKIEQAAVCGASLGGITALWLGCYAPRRIVSIIAADTAARIGTAATWDERIHSVRAHGLAPLADSAIGRWLTPAYREAHPQAVARLKAAFSTTSPEGYAGCCAALRDADLTAAIVSIRVPVLVLVGTDDLVTPPGDAHFLAAAIPGARILELPGAHLCCMESAEAFAACAVPFLSSQPAEGAPATALR